MGAARKIDIHGAKGGEEKPKTPTEAPDSLRSVAIAKMLIAVGEGEFEGTPTAADIYLDNTPLQDPQGNMNFPNVKWEWRTGAVDQTYIQGIPSVENETTISTELRSGTPWVRAISNIQLSAVRVRFAWPALQSVDAEGNINGYRIEYKVELATDGGAYQQVLSEAVDGKTTTVYERTRRIDLPKAATGWLMKITRLTINQNNNKISDTMQIAGFTEVIDAKIRYPNTALLYIEFSAEQFRSIPAVTVETKLKKMQVPSNYDPVSRSYTGVWDGTFKQAWADNPTWMTYDITTADRFGLGRRIKPWMVDKWELYRISQYCDQLVPDGKGGQEPRFICNLNLQGKADAWTLLRDISAIYRGMTYWAQGQVFTLSDMPRATDFDFAYTRANVIDGKFTYSSASERTRYTRALISYDNPANNYDTDVTAVTDQKLQRRYGDNPLEISAIGCTRESEAQRRGKWALLTNSKDRGVTFKVGLDGRIPLPGYVIPVADELLAGRPVGGRISAVNGKAITLDRDTQAKPGDRLILNLPDGKCEGRTVQLVSGRKVTVTTAYSVSPERELVWALDADDLAIPLYRVTSVSRPEPGVFEISAVQYDPSKFAHIDTGARLEERPISVIPITVVAPPASVTLSSSYMVDQGITVATMNISWPAVNGAVAYDVEWRKDSGNWIKVQRTGSTSVDVTGIYSGAYMARVRSVSAFEISSIWKSSNLTNLEGKVGLPPAVAFLTTTSELFGISIKWGFPPGAEDTQRTEVWYGAANSLPAATKLADLAYPQADYRMQQLKAGATLFFWARLVDRSGNIGPWFPDGAGVFGQSSTDADAILDMLVGEITESQLGQELLSEITQISGDGQGSVNERLELIRGEIDTIKDDLQGQIGDTNIALDRAKEDLLEQLSDTNAALTDVRAELQDQIDAIADLADSMPYKPDLTYTARQGALGANGIIYQALQNVPVNTPPPNATYWLDVGQAVVAANGLATRVQTVETKVTSIEGVNTAQATQITGLNSSLVTTNGNVTAAQNAANAANTLAGGKGKVIVQSAAPAVADQLAQNLWIDTTNNANTPKRWTGSVWAAVTDKAATDAAAAAANALALAQTKADASAVNSLTTRVTASEGTITSQGSAITGLTNSLTTTNGNVTTAQNAANAANTLAGGKGKVLVQSAAPAVADQLVQNLWIDTTNNANTPKRWTGSSWVAVTDKAATDAATAAANALALAQTKADASVVSSLTTRVTSVEGSISSQGSAITGLNNSLTTTNTNVTTAQTAATNAATLAGSKGKVMVQSVAPAAADQLAQNLWIDITGGANMPKRWTGSAWAAVTDKIATDAAAAAASALTQVATKADASTVQALSNAVTQQGETITAQGSAITTINANLGSLGASGVNLLPAEFSVFGSTSPQLAGIGFSSIPAADVNAMKGFALKLDWTELSDVLAGGFVKSFNGFDANMSMKRQKYIVSYYARASVEGHVVAMYLRGYLADNVTYRNSSNATQQPLTTEWVRYSSVVDMSAPEFTGTKMLLAFQMNRSGIANRVVWIDRVMVEPVANNATEPSAFVAGSSYDQGVANAAATTAVAARVTTAEGVITSQSSAINALNNNIAGKADASALNALTTRVSSAEGVNTTQAGQITNLTTTVNGKANASTVSDLSNKVTQQGETITAQGSAITSINANLGNLGSSGINLLPGEYTLFSKKLPVIGGVNFTASSAIDTGAISGYALKLNWSSGNDLITCQFSNSELGSDANMSMKRQKYIVSYYARASVEGHIVAMFLRGFASDNATGINSSNATQQPLTTEWVRYSSVVDLSDAKFTGSKMLLEFQMSRSGVSGRSVWIDRIMVEAAENGATEPSTFVSGSALGQSTANAEATSALTARVTAAEGVNTSQASQITSLTTSLDGKASSSALQSLTTRVTTTEDKNIAQDAIITSQGTAITSLNNTLSGLPASGVNLLPAEMSVFNKDMPDITTNSGLTTTTVADAAAFKGYALSSVITTTGTPGFILAKDFSFGACNMGLQRQKYIISFRAKANVSGHTMACYLRTFLADNTTVLTSTAPIFTLTTGWVRYSAVIDLTGAQWTGTCMALVFQPSRSGLANRTVLLDQIMVETAVAGNSGPSTFVVGNSFDQSTANATALDALTSTVTQQGTNLTSASTRVTQLENSVNSTSNGLATKASASSLDTLTNRVTVAEGVVTSSSGRITSLENSVNSTSNGLATKASTTALNSLTSTVTSQGNTLSAQAQQISGLQSSVGSNTAQLQSQATTIADSAGKISSSYTLKLAVTDSGRRYAAGFGIGLDNSSGAIQSQFIVSTDRFAILNTAGAGETLTSPFMVDNGQVFMADAVIKNGSITNAKIGDQLYSSNYVANQSGWILRKDGIFEINSTIPGAGRVLINGNGVNIYDQNGVLRVQLGNLG